VYVRDVLNLPNPYSEDLTWLDALTTLQKNKKYDLVIPCNDQAIIPVQNYKHEIRQFGQIYALEDDAFFATFNKHETLRLATCCGIKLPKWTLIDAVVKIGVVADEFEVPVVLKPVSSFDLRYAQRRREVRTIINASELLPTAEEMLHEGPVLVQSYFSGKGVGVELLAKNGKILVAFQHERVHEPPRGGGSSYRRSVPLTPSLLNAASEFVRAIRYTGVLMVEFRMNPETNEWILIETNGRFWGSLPLSYAAGLDFPLNLVEMLLKDRTDFDAHYKIGLYCRHLTRDWHWLHQNFEADRNDRTQQVVPLSQILYEIKNVLWLRERLDTLSLDDPCPFLLELSELMKEFKSRALDKASRLVRMFGPIKRYRTKRAIGLLQTARYVTFICFGNICRSPFAEKYAKLIAPADMQFYSAGTHCEAGRLCPLKAVASAASIGINLSEHKSRYVSQQLVKQSEVIIVFDTKNEKEIVRRFPRARNRIVRLSDFVPGHVDEIFDPINLVGEKFTKCYKMIADSLDLINNSCWAHGATK
jgi:protein-tyrosine-phosphatase/predicted ATP-grasp superfamily ATP-dependent carboligase